MKNKLLLLILFTQHSYFSHSQDTLHFIGNSAIFGLGINKGDGSVQPYKADNWQLLNNQSNFVIEYHIKAGKLFKPLSNHYSGFFESGLRLGYQSGRITNGIEKRSYSETTIGIPVSLGLAKKVKKRILKHAAGFAYYGSLLEEVKLVSETDRKWGFFSQARGLFFFNTQLMLPSKKAGRYHGIGIEVSRDVGFNYKSTAIPFVIENFRVGLMFTPFCDFF